MSTPRVEPTDRIDFGAWSDGIHSVSVAIVANSDVRCWGLESRERIRRLAGRRDYPVLNAPWGNENILICDARYWFEAGLLDWCAVAPGRAVMKGERLVIVHGRASDFAECMIADSAPLPSLREQLCVADQQMFFAELSKRESPLVMRLDQQSNARTEQRSFQASYRGVSDVLTQYCWPRPAFELTRLAARLAIAPNAVTALGTAFAAGACAAWWDGRYFVGALAALLFMLLDTVDGKLARCTVRASKLGDLFDHGVDVIFPPIAWVAWTHGSGTTQTAQQACILLIGCYLAQRAIEAIFLLRAGMQIHHWRRFDSRLKLITAQRNTLLPLAMLTCTVSGPEAALWLALAWSIICLAIHAARLIAVIATGARGDKVTSWMDGARS